MAAEFVRVDRMITSKVSKKQLQNWKKLFQEKKTMLKPNRISGIELDLYFQKKYEPQVLNDIAFKEVVSLNVKEQYGEVMEENVNAYVIDNIYVGIDLDTGFFQVESKDIQRCVPIYDDLFVTRGLSALDLQNYVLTGQYIELTDC